MPKPTEDRREVKAKTTARRPVPVQISILTTGGIKRCHVDGIETTWGVESAPIPIMHQTHATRIIPFARMLMRWWIALSVMGLEYQTGFSYKISKSDQTLLLTEKQVTPRLERLPEDKAK